MAVVDASELAPEAPGASPAEPPVAAFTPDGVPAAEVLWSLEPPNVLWNVPEAKR